MHKISASHENYSGCLSSGGKFWRKILAENSGGKLWRKTMAENFGASQNLGKYTEFRRLAKIQAYDGTMADVEISAPR
jgi:hypothetical protein